MNGTLTFFIFLFVFITLALGICTGIYKDKNDYYRYGLITGAGTSFLILLILLILLIRENSKQARVSQNEKLHRGNIISTTALHRDGPGSYSYEHIDSKTSSGQIQMGELGELESPYHNHPPDAKGPILRGDVMYSGVNRTSRKSIMEAQLLNEENRLSKMIKDPFHREGERRDLENSIERTRKIVNHLNNQQ